MAEDDPQEVEVEKKGVTINPGTGVSVALVVAIIGTAITVGNSFTELKAEQVRTREMLTDIKSSVSEMRSENRTLANALTTHEAWSGRISTELRMGLNEVRRKAGLQPLGEINPYVGSNGRSGR